MGWRGVGDYMDVVEAARPALNVACLVPHGVVRFAAMGLESRPPERHELAALRAHVQGGMGAGGRGPAAGPVQISHFKAAGRENWGRTKDSIRLVEQARAEEVDVMFDAYPYTAASTILWAVARRTEAGGAETCAGHDRFRWPPLRGRQTPPSAVRDVPPRPGSLRSGGGSLDVGRGSAQDDRSAGAAFRTGRAGGTQGRLGRRDRRVRPAG